MNTRIDPTKLRKYDTDGNTISLNEAIGIVERLGFDWRNVASLEETAPNVFLVTVLVEGPA